MDRICGNRRRGEFASRNCWVFGVEAMMRLVIYFLFGILLGSSAIVARAETIPATTGTYEPTLGPWHDNIGKGYSEPTVDALCQRVNAFYFGGKGVYGGSTLITKTQYRCNFTYNGTPYTNLTATTTAVCANGGSYSGATGMCTGSTCPSGQGWTLSGANCTRPDCPAGSTRQGDGTCASPCPMYNPATAADSQPQSAPAGCSCPSGTTWYPFNGCRKTCGTAANGAIGGGADYYIDKTLGSQCAGGCEAYPTGDWMDATDGKHRWTQLASSGYACKGTTQDTTQPDNNDPKLDPTKKKPPVCGSSDGVMTTNTGKVLCVPEGTPDARKPDIKIKTKIETFPDNSTRTTTETQTTDPATHATDTRSSTTTSTKPDGTEGQAGKAGTSTSTSNVSGTGPGGNGDGDGDGGCDPTLNFCGGPATEGLYTKKEKTLDSVVTTFQNTVKGSAIGSASTTFFNVSTPSGGCPGWSVTVPMLNITLDGSAIFCSSAIINAMNAAGAVLLALATYIAFTWAFL